MMLSIVVSSLAFPTVGIVGAHGGLGRELVQQCMDRSWNPIAIVRRNDKLIYPPVREGWLEEDAPDTSVALPVPIVVNPQRCPPECDALVFAMSGSPFRSADDSTTTVQRLCNSLPTRCRRVVLVSAHGVGDSIQGANAGIQLMRSWYLKSTYEEKEQRGSNGERRPERAKEKVKDKEKRKEKKNSANEKEKVTVADRDTDGWGIGWMVLAQS